MKPLMPELERQLRAAVREGRIADVQSGAADAKTPVRPSRVMGLRPAPVLGLICVTVALVIAGALVLHAHRASPPASAHRSGPYGWSCNERIPLQNVHRLQRVLVRGEARTWVVSQVTLTLPSAGRGTRPHGPFSARVLDLGGRVYLLGSDQTPCAGGPNASQGIGQDVVWWIDTKDALGSPSAAGSDRLIIKGERVRRWTLGDGFMFLAVLPASRCGHGLSLLLYDRKGRQPWFLALPRCTTVTPRTPVLIGAPAGVRRGEFNEGQAVVSQTGCLACHQIGSDGNNGPGPKLTRIGARLGAAQLQRALIDPRAPMPSFRELKRQHPKQFAALLYFLRELK